MVNTAMGARSMSSGIVKITHTHEGRTTYYGSISSLTVLLETKFFDLDGYTSLQQAVGNFEKTIVGVLLEIGNGMLENVSLYVGTKQRLKDDPVWYGPFSLEEADEMIHTIGVEDARHFAFRVVDTAPLSCWSMSAMELYGSISEGRV